MSVLSLHPVFTNLTATTTILHSLVQTRTNTGRFVVLSTHSNPKIVKANRKSQFKQPLSLYYDTDEEEEEDDDDDDVAEDNWLADDDKLRNIMSMERNTGHRRESKQNRAIRDHQ
ncbi:hypothetical protein ACOSP7_030248 [Xanthoceras sorbifolium]